MPQLKISETWLKGLTGTDREEMKKLVLNSEKVLDKLKEILYNMQVKKSEVSLEDYDNPSWSHRQAHLNGEASALRRVVEILTIKERDDQSI